MAAAAESRSIMPFFAFVKFPREITLRCFLAPGILGYGGMTFDEQNTIVAYGFSINSSASVVSPEDRAFISLFDTVVAATGLSREMNIICMGVGISLGIFPVAFLNS